MESEDTVGNLEIASTEGAPELPAQRPDSEDGFASMVAETLRGLTNEQRLYAQREIIKVLNQARYIGSDSSLSSHDAGQSSRRMEETDQQPQRAQQQYDSVTSGFLHDRYGIAYSPQRDGDRNFTHTGQVADEDSSDLEWGFTLENSFSP